MTKQGKQAVIAQKMIEVYKEFQNKQIQLADIVNYQADVALADLEK